MDNYSIRDVTKGDSQYAIATNAEGKWGILSINNKWGYQTYSSVLFNQQQLIQDIVCPFIYDHIYWYCIPQMFHVCTFALDTKPQTDELYQLSMGNKVGWFSTLLGTVIVNAVPKGLYYPLVYATTEGLVGCIKIDTGGLITYVFLNKNGEEIITLERGWRIVRGFMGGKAIIRKRLYDAEVDSQGIISNLVERERSNYTPEDDEKFYRDRDYRAAFEDDPGSIWNVD